jgi:hypothetical protein
MLLPTLPEILQLYPQSIISALLTFGCIHVIWIESLNPEAASLTSSLHNLQSFFSK